MLQQHGTSVSSQHCGTGNILTRWTNDRFVSTPRRVINRSGRERYSQPFFFDPGMDVMIEALPTCVPLGESGQHIRQSAMATI